MEEIHFLDVCRTIIVAGESEFEFFCIIVKINKSVLISERVY